jgi:hypothetical protein
VRVELPAGLDDEQRQALAIRQWITRNDHERRAQSNPLHWLTPDGALAWLDHRLTVGLVFNYQLMNRWHARRLALSLLSLLEGARYASRDFVIEDCTFSDVLVIVTDVEALVVAILGED